MRCPFCHAEDTRVIDSRLHHDGDQVRRRRQCGGCGARFNTHETAQVKLPNVVKGDGRREAFSEAKLRDGMQKALQKRPVSTADLDAAVHRILCEVSARAEREIPARRVGEWVMRELRQLDQVAYVRFASVYRRFEDVQAFREEIERLEQDVPAELRKRQLSLLGDDEDAS